MQRSRDKRALEALDNYLGDAVGRAYVSRYFPASAKAKVSELVDNIVDAFHGRVEAIDWLAPATKQEALAKVDTLVVSVGYPDNWRDYSIIRWGRVLMPMPWPVNRPNTLINWPK